MTLSKEKKTAAFCVLAHQDDEVFLQDAIREEMRAGKEVVCAFLTNGEGYHPIGKVRMRESRAFLGRLGVLPQNIHFFGYHSQIPDEKLVYHLEKAWAFIQELAQGFTVNKVLTLGWEGGHPDHDAAHLLALALAKECGVERETYQTFLYNGESLSWKFFRVGAGPKKEMLPTVKVGARLNAIRILFSGLRFRSQWKSWLGLIPVGVWGALCGRGIETRPVSLKAIQARPHAGKLLYERWGRESWEQFWNEAFRFLQTRRLVEENNV